MRFYKCYGQSSITLRRLYVDFKNECFVEKIETLLVMHENEGCYSKNVSVHINIITEAD